MIPLNQIHRIRLRHLLHLPQFALDGPGANLSLVNVIAGLLMRLFGGSLDKAAAENSFNGKFQRTLWPELAALRVMGAVEDTGAELLLTESGNYLWVMMMREFFTGVNNLRDEMRDNIIREKMILPAG